MILSLIAFDKNGFNWLSGGNLFPPDLFYYISNLFIIVILNIFIMIDNGFVQMIKEGINIKFENISEKEKSMIIRICNVLFFLGADSAFMEIYNKSNNAKELFRDSLRLSKMVIEDFEFKIRIVEEKENKSLEEHRFLFMLRDIKNFFEEYKELL